MKIFIVLPAFAIIISCIQSSCNTLDMQNYNVIVQNVRRYCALPVENRKIFRFCLHENGVGIGPEFYRNCAQQVKFGQTFEEIDKFVCQSGTRLESLFFKCFIPAYNTFNLDNPKAIPAVRKCLSNEENGGFDAKDHVKEVFRF